MSSRTDDPTATKAWTPGSAAAVAPSSPVVYDTNNNSSSCANQEQQQSSRDIAELGKNIGNEFRGQFIVLPNHLVAFDEEPPVDDEVSSNSEDCVYAYRGDQYQQQLHNSNQHHHQNQQPIAVDGADRLPGGAADEAGAARLNAHHDEEDDNDDDETDFLEMDFDPEPNSEQENNARDDFDPSSFLERTKALNEWRDRNEPIAGSSRRGAQVVAIEELPVDVCDVVRQRRDEDGGKSQNHFVDISSNGYYDRGDNESDSGTVAYADQSQAIVKVTGTKPKVKVQQQTITSDANTTTTTRTTTPVPQQIPPTTSNEKERVESKNLEEKFLADVKERKEDVTCLECSHMELASTSRGNSTHCKKHCKKLRNHEPSPEPRAPSLAEGTRQIEICPNILDEENIFNSFLLLGVELQRERLHEQLQANRLAVERAKTIAGYLIKFAKANCDPRRFVALIEKCCPQAEFSQLDFHFQTVSAEFDCLQVPAVEILSRWSSEQGLRELSRVPNRRFQAANVLGRVASLLRLRGGGREMDQAAASLATAVVMVPTYLRPGVLLISRRERNQTKAT